MLVVSNMKQLLTILFSLLSLVAFAQEATVKSVAVDPFNISASKYPMTDLNGNTAPLVIVRVLADDVQFQGSVLSGGVKPMTGEYWVYMGSGAKFLHIHSSKFLPVEIYFPDYDIPRLESAATYIVTLALPQAVAQPAVTQQKVEIKFSPADAIVLIDGQIINSAGGIATTALPADRDYSFTVTSRGYIAQQGTFRLHSAVPTRLNIELTPDPAAATPTSTPTFTPASPSTPVQAIAPAAIATTGRYGVMNLNRVVQSTSEYNYLQEEISRRTKRAESEYAGMQEQLAQMYDAYKRNPNQNDMKAIEELTTRLSSYRDTAQNELEAYKTAELTKINSKVSEIATLVGRETGLTAIVSSEVPLYVGADVADVTDKIISKLKNR